MDHYQLIVILAFLIRLSFTFLFNKSKQASHTSDEVGHQAHEILIRKKKRDDSYLKTHFINRDQIGYPSLFHEIVVKLFGKRNDVVLRRYLSGFFSMLFPLIFLIFGKLIFTQKEVYFGLLSLLLSLSCFGLFLRQYKAYTARSFADFLLFSGFFFVILYTTTSNIYFMLIAIVLFSMVWFSSEFGIQLLILIPILWSIISQNPMPFVALIGSLCLALLINRKKIMHILNHKFLHWIWYYRNQDIVLKKNNYLANTSYFKKLYQKLTSNIIIDKVLQFIPFLLIFFILSIANYSINPVINGFIIACCVFSFLTATNKFKFLGPGFRYSLFAIPYMWILFFKDFEVMSQLFLGIEIILALIFSLLVMRDLTSINNNKSDLELEEIKKWIALTDSKYDIILTSPITLVNIILIINKDIKSRYFTFFDNTFNPYYLDLYEKHIEYPKLCLESDLMQSLEKKLNANCIIIDKRFHFSDEELIKLDKLRTLYKCITESKSYIVFET
jgi:hypothetical protein